MPVIGFHSSSEQIHPARLLDDVRHAEEVGFTAAMCSDHLAPWNRDQGHSDVRVSADLGQHAAWIAEYAELGFEEIYLHHVGQDQRGFLDAFGDHVLPQLAVRRPEPAVAS